MSSRRPRAVRAPVQTAWDRHLADRPVLLVLVGSDLAMMRQLTDYGRPLYGRPSFELHLDPLSPSDIADACGIAAIKWRTRRLFSGDDARALEQAAHRVAGVGAVTRYIGVSSSGFGSTRLDVELGPDDLLAAWRSGISRGP